MSDKTGDKGSLPRRAITIQSNFRSVVAEASRRANTTSPSSFNLKSIINNYPMYDLSSSAHQVLPNATLNLTESVCNPPWLTASNGDIIKSALTLFSNSSQISYRAMPASVESCVLDKTSFVEKYFIHKIVFPVSYYIEVAKLWALSNRSELECRYTQANSGSREPQELAVVQKRLYKRPISHPVFDTGYRPRPPPQNLDRCGGNEKENTEEELVRNIKRFMECCRVKDESLSSPGL